MATESIEIQSARKLAYQAAQTMKDQGLKLNQARYKMLEELCKVYSYKPSGDFRKDIRLDYKDESGK